MKRKEEFKTPSKYLTPVSSNGGRPKLLLNEEGKQLVEILAGYMCTDEEIAASLGTTTDLLHNANNKAAFMERKEKGFLSGKASLRRKQFKLAEKNASMAIWLGKIYLGQRDMDIVAAAEASTNMASYADIFSRPAAQRSISDIEGDPE